MLNWLLRLVRATFLICIAVQSLTQYVLSIASVSALLNTMSMYHDTLLTKFVQSHPKYRPLIPSSLHTRYTRAWSDKSALYKWIARSLELIRYLELLVEMGLRRKVSVNVRWRSIVFIEIIKCGVISPAHSFDTDSCVGLSCASFC